VVSEIRPGSFTLHTDAGSDLTVQLPEGVGVVRVPPGAKDLKAATKITVGDIGIGDRVLVRGRLSDDQKSIVATTVMVMTQTDLTKAHEAERLEWQRRGIGGLVKVVNPQTKEITISVANTPPTPGNPTHPVIVSLAPNAALLRYAPDSVKFSDAKPSTLEEIKVGDQVRALGSKSEDGNRFAAEKLVSGTFRNLGATVISVDAPSGVVTVKDLATGKPVVVRTNADSMLHRLPPFLAQMIAWFNSGAPAGMAGQAPGGAAGSTLLTAPSESRGAGGAAGTAFRRSSNGGPGQGPGAAAGSTSLTAPSLPAQAGESRGAGGTERAPEGGPPPEGRRGSGAAESSGPQGGAGGGGGRGARDFQQMLERTPPFTLGELKAGEALIVVSTEGAKPSEVTAIVMLTGVEPILEARPKGSNEVVLGPWNMSMGGGEGGPQ
jgi:transcription antitermination factor NusG